MNKSLRNLPQEFQRIAALFVLLVTFTVVNVRNATQVTFVWEEWYHLLAISEGTYEGLVWGGSGYLNILGNALFMIENQVFGTWYPGYVLVNSALVVGSTLIAYRNCPQHYRWLGVGFIGLILFSSSVLFTVGFGNEVGDLLAILMGVIALDLHRRGKGLHAVAIALIVSTLANNLVGVVVAGTVFGFIMYSLGSSDARVTVSRSLRVAAAVLVIPIAFAGLLALMDVTLFDSEVAPVTAQTNEVARSFASSFVVAVSSLVYWTFIPLLPSFLSLEGVYLGWLMEILNRPYVVVVGIVTLIAVVFLVSRPAPATGSSQVSNGKWWNPFVLLTGAAGFAVLLAFFREANGYDLRFAIFWLPSVAVFLVVVIRTIQMKWRAISMALGALLVAANAAAIGIAIWLPGVALDMERPRTTYSMQMVEDLKQCPMGQLPKSVGEIASGLTWQEVCQAYGVVAP